MVTPVIKSTGKRKKYQIEKKQQMKIKKLTKKNKY